MYPEAVAAAGICAPCQLQVESACNLPWFLGQECFDKLKEQSKDTRGVALPNFLSSSVFHTMFMHSEWKQLKRAGLQLRPG